MKKILLIFLLALLTPTYALADNSIPPATLWISHGVNPPPVLTTDGKGEIIAKLIHEQSQLLNYYIDVRYPLISSTTLKPADKHFNQLIQNFIKQNVDQFKQDIKSSAKNVAIPNVQSYLKINYQLAGFVSKSQNTDFNSIRFQITRYERGMAHPANTTYVVNYDLAQNQPIILADVFNPNTHYLATIADYCNKQLQTKNLPDASLIASGAAPKPENYQNWNLTLSGLLITFDEAQVAPRYFGNQEILIPYKDLKDIIARKTACTVGLILCDAS